MLQPSYRASLLFGATAAAGILFVIHAAQSDGAAATSSVAPRVVNVSSDSEPSWVPTKEDEDDARKTAIEYLADLDSAKYTDAYAFLAEIDRKNQPFATFTERVRDFNDSAGAVLERRIIAVTWTKNS